MRRGNKINNTSQKKKLNYLDKELNNNYFKNNNSYFKKTTKSPLGPNTEYLLGGLVGVGGTSRVYKLGKLDKVVIKV
jgi:hypothetical protein